ncbi:hypothetical protein ACOQFV_24410 [Nocardiopsis changdeensis]|uniref:Uncharacterized protein n=1 Tax=Nocardiopsis changdeensis TaxID=2831969 RepID=A0A975KUX0_9ACTN|nr:MULTISPECIES: hypothetical protein [Nocardiopsis]QUX26466.1 hypothetical protein KGD84_32730 [Nocardiopsis changdeensis]QYX40738.1 hypothetical protein K1J57_32580 [Nocardiopsis sp. MT53]
MTTATSTRVLRWTREADTGSYSDLHDESCMDLRYRVTRYFEAIASGEADRLTVATEMLRREERGYWANFESSPRDIIDAQDSAVIAAHADLVVPVVFNAEADEVAAAFAALTDLDHDVHFPWNTFQGTRAYAREYRRVEDAMTAYRAAYPSAPTTSAEVVHLRRALSVWTITG